MYNTIFETHLIQPFLAGYMMGDGYIGDSRKKLCANLCGNRDFIQGARSVIPDEIKHTNIYNSHKTTSTLFFGQSEHVISFLDWVYSVPCSFFEFDRKYAKYKEYKENPYISPYDKIEELTPQIVKMHEEGLTPYAIAKELGISKTGAKNALKRVGNYSPSQTSKETSGRIFANKEAIIDRYLAGVFVHLIGKEFGCSGRTIAKYLKEWGVTGSRCI